MPELPDNTAMLRDPEFGNEFALVLNVRMHRTLNNDLRTMPNPNLLWQRFKARYVGNSPTQIAQFKAWVTASYGNVVALTDYENRTWTGIITSTSIPIFRGMNNDSNSCNYSTEFEFEGSVA